MVRFTRSAAKSASPCVAARCFLSSTEAVSKRFVAREKSNFEQLNARTYTINIPERPYLPFLGGKLKPALQ